MGLHRSRQRIRHWRAVEPRAPLTKREWLADLTPELKALIDYWDPVGIVDIAPGEYDFLTGSILGLLAEGADRVAICEFMHDEASRWLGFTPEAGNAFGAKVYAWFESKQQPWTAT